MLYKIKHTRFAIIGLLISGVLVSGKIDQPRIPGQLNGFVVDTIAKNLNVPWQIVFLPDGTMLFTERSGHVRIYREGKLLTKPALTIPNIPLEIKTGMLGMVIHPDFKANRFVYVAYNYRFLNKIRLAIDRLEFRKDSLVDPKHILYDLPANPNHTGCRLVFGPDQKLWITTGDADEPFLAQDLKFYNGKILRVNDDGTPPPDNPFVHNDTAKKEIWSFGHRNSQGLTFEPITGQLYETEHGPTGGDEINMIFKGANYGWPIIHHLNSHPGMKMPIAEFTPSIAPGEALFYTGNSFPQLKNDLLVACLRGESILHIVKKGSTIVRKELLLKGHYGRIRSLVMGPDGFLYFSTSNEAPVESAARENYDLILRLRPANNLTAKFSNNDYNPIARRSRSYTKDRSLIIFQQLCMGCHGNELQGNAKVQNLGAGKFLYGSDKKSIKKNITNGLVDLGMPAWRGTLTESEIDRLSEFIVNYPTHRRGSQSLRQ